MINILSLAEILLLRFPTDFNNGNIQVHDDGFGQYIKEWKVEGFSFPAKSDIELWREEVALQARVNEVRILRHSLYPPIPEQLDMLYWDRINGTTKWEDLIQEIKLQFPIPTE